MNEKATGKGKNSRDESGTGGSGMNEYYVQMIHRSQGNRERTFSLLYSNLKGRVIGGIRVKYRWSGSIREGMDIEKVK